MGTSIAAEPSSVTVIALPLPWSPAQRSDSRPLSNSEFYGARPDAPNRCPDGWVPHPAGRTAPHPRLPAARAPRGPPAPGDYSRTAGAGGDPCPGPGGAGAVPGAQPSQTVSSVSTSADTAWANRSRSGTAAASATSP
ncbi:hypothetical protein GCM10010300_78440 [Streptomyces olivaceoviridis]|nr:hypothetical protein GCM10010300_78440 [Streptomyces olivaceoviridis]